MDHAMEYDEYDKRPFARLVEIDQESKGQRLLSIWAEERGKVWGRNFKTSDFILVPQNRKNDPLRLATPHEKIKDMFRPVTADKDRIIWMHWAVKSKQKGNGSPAWVS